MFDYWTHLHGVLEASPVAGERQFSVDLSKLVFMVSGENIVTHLLRSRELD
jgi:hypothetical protein